MMGEPRENLRMAELAEARDNNTYQNVDSFPEGTVENESNGRREATPAEKERMDKDIEKLADIFAGTNAKWQLDGAINISLMKGEYIGAHKDVDLTLDPDSLGELETHLFEKGYGLFLSMEDAGDQTKKVMKWVSAEEFKKSPDGHQMLAAINEKGEINKNESLSFIDVHLTKKDENGQPVGFLGEKLPTEWHEPQWISFHEKSVPLSPPAKVAYFKLFSGRAVDQDDLQKLTEMGKLSEADITQIETAVTEGFNNRNEKANEAVLRMAGKITKQMSDNEIAGVIASDPALSGAPSAAKEKRIDTLATAILSLGEISPENVWNVANKVFGFSEEENRIREQIKLLKQ